MAESGLEAAPSEACDQLSAPSEHAPVGRVDTASEAEELGPRAFAVGVGICAAALAVFSVVQIRARAPHEDETLALFVGRHSLWDMLSIVLGQRGGAPLHFLLAWFVAHLGGGLVPLRLLSAACAVAAVPVVAALGARLAGRTAGLVATAIVAASWVLVFQAVFGRMYALFLLTSALSYLALVCAVDRGGRRRWVLWGIAVLATIATHPYGVLVLASQGLFVLANRQRIREAAWAFGAVLVAGTPFWLADLVLSRRFKVGVGGGGAQLGAPGPVLRYLRYVAGDFLTTNQLWLGIFLGLGLVGLVVFARTRPATGLLIGSVVAVPTVTLLATRLTYDASPESRHLIFALPFVALAIAAGILELAGRRLRTRLIVAGVALAVILPLQIQSASLRTPQLFHGESPARAHAREAAAAWLASTARPNDVLFGYDAVFLLAWERQRRFSDLVVPRAPDGVLAAHVLSHAGSLGRGVWVLDAGDTSNRPARPTIALRYPRPQSAFEARVFGPFLVIRTRKPTVTPTRYLALAASTMQLGRSLAILDDDQNLHTIELTQGRLGISG
jgi:mannosyltransferase